MIKFSINNKKYKIEKIRIKDLYYILDAMKYEEKEAGIKIISELSGAPESEVALLKTYQFNPLYSLLVEKLKITRNYPLQTKIYLNGIKYGFINFENMTIGELADLEIIKADPKADYLTHQILSILYRPITKDREVDYEVEEYNGAKCKKRSEDFLELDVEVMYGAIFFFNNFHTNFHRSYSKSLGGEGDGDGEGSQGGIIPTKQKTIRYWIEVFYLIAGEDPLKLNEAANIGIYHCFNFLVRKKEQYKKEMMEMAKSRGRM